MDTQTVDLGAMTREALLHLKQEVHEELEKRRAAQVEAFRENARQTAEDTGLSLEELVGVAPKQKTEERVALPPKYRNSASGETWSGKGPSPKWICESGRPKEDFLINHG